MDQKKQRFASPCRAELAFVVTDIAYVEYIIMPVEAFFTLMITAFMLNVLVPVTITWWRPHYLKARQSPSSPGVS